ncbi:unknown protein [Desulfotalea psychrophila LSv54]|uniref:Uncharacterized protein n=1 Tax=Desulfotalea psychrophila (strain LSv54 / DSM 12343) TaxID=177439 RepID=Q6AKN8_DESPS|nr:unknown protein [Desulfotalea psychrophila LSv54]
MPCNTRHLQQSNFLQRDLFFSQLPPLRNGDLIILHLKSNHDLEQLIANKSVFDQCRLILIIRKEVFESSRSYHYLNR